MNFKARGGVQPFSGVKKQDRLILKKRSVGNSSFLPFVSSNLGSRDIVCTSWGRFADFCDFLHKSIIENLLILSIFW